VDFGYSESLVQWCGSTVKLSLVQFLVLGVSRGGGWLV
jgi:hypothetical protein